MAWEPIEVTEQDVHRFAEHALQFYNTLDERGKALAREAIERAGTSEQSGGAEPDGVARSNDGSQAESLQRLTAMLLRVWEPGTTIAPLYSGDMPRTGGGTVD